MNAVETRVRQTHAVSIIEIETREKRTGHGLHIAKIAPSIFLNEQGNADVWLEIGILNRSKENRTLSAVKLSFANKVWNIQCMSSLLYKEGAHEHGEPPWRSMFGGFCWESSTLCSFTYNLVLRISKRTKEIKVCAIPFDFQVSFDESENGLDHAIACMLYNFTNLEGDLPTIEPFSDGQPAQMATFFIKWYDPNVSIWLDECSFTFDYLINGIRRNTSAVYTHVVLPHGALLVSSTSVPEIKSFNPRRARFMFNAWVNQYKIDNTRERRIIRVDNQNEKYGDYLYSTANYTFPKKRLIKQIALFTSGVVIGSFLSSLIALIISEFQKPTLDRFTNSSVYIAVFGSILLVCFAIQIVQRILEHHPWKLSDIILTFFPSLRRWETGANLIDEEVANE